MLVLFSATTTTYWLLISRPNREGTHCGLSDFAEALGTRGPRTGLRTIPRLHLCHFSLAALRHAHGDVLVGWISAGETGEMVMESARLSDLSVSR